MAFDPGDVWTPQLTVKDADGVLTAATVTVEVTNPSGTVTSPTVGTSATGIYTADVPLTEPGRWLAVWAVSGSLIGVETQDAYVRRLGANVISVSDVKARLNKTLAVDDAEIEDMLDAAVAEYERLIGPVSGSVTEKHHGGSTSLVLNTATASAITAASYADGTVIALGDLDLDTRTGIVHWAYNTAGWFTWGSRNVTVTYTVGALPADHREVIVADVAGYFAATQRGNTASALPSDYTDAFAPQPGHPVVLFPRIRALAAQIPSIA